jgi:hypothetical protein
VGNGLPCGDTIVVLVLGKGFLNCIRNLKTGSFVSRSMTSILLRKTTKLCIVGHFAGSVNLLLLTSKILTSNSSQSACDFFRKQRCEQINYTNFQKAVDKSHEMVYNISIKKEHNPLAVVLGIELFRITATFGEGRLFLFVYVPNQFV